MKRKTLLFMVCFCLIPALIFGQQKAISQLDVDQRQKTEIRESILPLPSSEVLKNIDFKSVIFYEDFDGAFPEGWQNIVVTGPEVFPGWEWTDTGGDWGGQLLSTTAENGYMILDSDAYGVFGVPEEANLISPPIDCSDATESIFFSVEHWARTFGAADISIYISTDDFATETLLYNWSGGAINSANGPNPVFSLFDITSIAQGQSNVKIKFNWIGEYDYWWLVDDVTIFEASTFSLTMLDPIGMGEVIPAPGIHDFTIDATINLNANPAFGYTFDVWNLGDVADPAFGRTTITMDSDKTVQATFAEIDLDLLWHQFSYGGNANNSAVIDETLEFEVADNFSNTAIDEITKIVVQGLPSGYVPGSTHPFIVRFYEHTTGEPDWENPVSVQTVDANAYFVEILSWNPGFSVFKFELDLPEAVNLQQGWVSVQSTAGSFFWLRADQGTGDGNAWQRIFNPAGDPNENLAYDFMLEVWGTGLDIAPECVAYLAPADEAVNVPLNVQLSWQASPNADGYELFIGETLPATGIDVGNVTSFQTNLEYSTTYQWKVVPYNAFGSAEDCEVWSFTTLDDPTQTLPWAENFTGLELGQIPVGWTRTHTNWGAVTTTNAGGTAPEMRFNWTPSATSVFKLISPPLEAVEKTEYRLVFKHFINVYEVPATYKVQTSADGENWDDIWSVVDPDANVGPESVIINLGEVNNAFFIAWVYDGNSFNTDGWFIDDIVVEEVPTEPIFSINPDPEDGVFDFGTIVISEQSAPQTFTIQNAGAGTLVISRIMLTEGDIGSFILENVPVDDDILLGAGESHQFTATFAPVSDGLKEANLFIQYESGAKSRDEAYNLTLQGTGFDATLIPPFEVNFDPFPPDFWTRPYGQLTEDTEFITPAGANWFQGNFANNAENPLGMRINLWVSAGASPTYRWFMSPPINMGDGSIEYELLFDVAVTNFFSQVPNQLGPDDYFAVIVSLDGGETWSSDNVIFELSGAEGDEVAAGGETILLNLNDITGTVKLAFYAERPSGTTPDIDLHVANVRVRVKPEIPEFAISDEAWDFGDVGINEQSLPKVFIISNDGVGELIVQAPVLDNQDDFILDFNAEDYPASLEANETVTFNVIFAPTEEGPVTGQVSIDYSDGGRNGEALVTLSGNGFVRPAGSTCDNPLVVTLPVEDYEDNTEAYGNDYLGTWVDPSTNYLNGNDFVAQFTLDEPGFLSGSVSGSWTGVTIVQDCPDPDNPAARLAIGSGSAGGSFTGVFLEAGTYFAIVSTWPTPVFTDFTLNLSFEPLPECPEPSNLAATNVTATTAELGWTEIGDATSWNVEWDLAGFELGTGNLEEGVDNPFLLTGLETGTAYAFYVQSICGEETSEWVGPVTFTTQLITPVPWFEGFATTTLPQGWTAIPFWSIGTTPAIPPIDGNYIRRNLWSSAVTGTIATINVGPVEENMVLSFDYALADWDAPNDPPAPGSGDFVVSISTDFGLTYLEQETIVNDGVEGWQGYQIDLSAFVGEYVKLKIDANWFSGDYWLAFDNFYVGLPTVEGITVDVKVILEGAFLPDEGTLMRTTLNPDVPLSQPYGPELPYFGNNNPKWYYTGDESVDVMPTNVVDWVLVELRDAAAANQATVALAKQAALLLNTGHIVGTDGQPLVFDVEIEQGLYVVVYHRNHLGVMSSQALPEVGGVYTWDFTQELGKAYVKEERAAYLNGHKPLPGGFFGMFGGDGDGDGQVVLQDQFNVFNPLSGQAGYWAGDFDMDGSVLLQDLFNILNPNSGIGTQVP
ncbi:MAG: choice-of-anchor D domain-containing protein [Bacteroidetes bacterium]|nr:MAG: choice-of-anchor D domain-containing protein [Bacteroidota bacterium]